MDAGGNCGDGGNCGGDFSFFFLTLFHFFRPIDALHHRLWYVLLVVCAIVSSGICLCAWIDVHVPTRGCFFFFFFFSSFSSRRCCSRSWSFQSPWDVKKWNLYFFFGFLVFIERIIKQERMIFFFFVLWFTSPHPARHTLICPSHVLLP